jgi:hypothetical protein
MRNLLRWTRLPMGNLMALGSVVLLIFFLILYLLMLKMPQIVSK